jgi:hypothetical protein
MRYTNNLFYSFAPTAHVLQVRVFYAHLKASVWQDRSERHSYAKDQGSEGLLE